MAKYEPSHLKNKNTEIVFRQFRSGESLFVNEIARVTKISVPTVMKIVDSLIAKELVQVQEVQEVSPKVGRKPNMLELNRSKYFSIGVIYEGDYLQLGIVDLAGEVTHASQVRVGKNFGDSIIRNIDRLLDNSGREVENLIGIGIGLPCIFNPNTREIIAPLIGIEEPQYFGDTIDKIAALYNSQVIVDNDLNIQAYGEYVNLAANPKHDLVFISLGTGLGAGVIIDGNIRHGNSNICGEIGYMMYSSDEEKEHLYLEDIINFKALETRFGVTESLGSKEQIRKARAYVARHLAILVNNLIFTYDISDVVLDGLVLEILGNELLVEIQERLNAICFSPTEIRRKDSPWPGILGGGFLVENQWLNNFLK